MLASVAASKTVGVPARTLVWGTIQSLAGPPVGTYATDPNTGSLTWLHWRYTGNLNCNLRSGNVFGAPDDVPQKIVVDFDSPGCFSLPFDGTIQLVGGQGEYLFFIDYSISMAVGDYEPTLHTLRTFVRGGSTYTVPDNHVRIWGYNSAVTLQSVQTGEVITPSTVYPGTPVQPGEQYIATRGATIISGWIG